MSYIKIRRAEIGDLTKVIEFISNHWSSKHIFVTSPQLLEYYHVVNGKLNFVIAEDQVDNKIYGICGYIPSNTTDHPDIWTVIWKVIKTDMPSLGIDIIEFIRKETKCRMFASCGINIKTIPIYRFLGYKVNKLEHYYQLGDVAEYNIAEINDKRRYDNQSNLEYSLIQIANVHELMQLFNLEKYQCQKPYKDKWYLEYKYFNHPIYKYRIYGIQNSDGNIEAIMIIRRVECNGSSILRIVDFIGEVEDIANIGNEIQRLLIEENHEYIDFYCHGIDNKILSQANFIKRIENDTNIIPNYFEPFERKNKEIYFFTNENEDMFMFKGDGDQDRPNS